MPLVLSKPFSSDTSVDPFDVRQIKKALNRLGYYQPLETTGITGIPDKAMFDALKKLQADHGLTPTGRAKPDDDTVRLLSAEVENRPSGYYLWRAVDDKKVRQTHAVYNGTVRAWADAPDPGEDYNCRCWAEPVKEIVVPENVSDEVKDAFEEIKETLNSFDQNNLYQSARLLRHYLGKSGTLITMPVQTWDNNETVRQAININQRRFEESLIKGDVDGRFSELKNKLLSLKDGEEIELKDYWDVDKSKIQVLLQGGKDFFWSIGSVKIRSKAVIQAKRNQYKISLNGKVIHSFDDSYDFKGGLDNPINELGFGKERLLVQEGCAKVFPVHWEKSQHITGIIDIDESKDIQKSFFTWKDYPQ